MQIQKLPALFFAPLAAVAAATATTTLISCDTTKPTTPPPANVSAITQVNVDPATSQAKVKTLPGAEELVAIREVSTVVAVNESTRVVTLRHRDGSTVTYKLSKDVINFPQIKVGDLVTATVSEELAVFFRRAFVPPEGNETEAVAVPLPGGKPGFLYIDTISATGNVLAIDYKKHTVTVVNADGSTKKVKVRSNVDISNVQPGDDIFMRLTENVAIVMQSPNAPATLPAVNPHP